jgi:hypothetical protein
MAQVKGVNVTIVQARTSDKVSDGLIVTKQRVWTDSFEAAALAAGTIVIADLPVGAKVQEVEVYHDALGATTLAIGDGASATRFLAATSVAAAGKLESANVDGFNYVVGTATDDNLILLTNAGAITGTIKSVVKYTLA